ncbi:MAG: TerB family tellurite resistance protein, partial [Betaproteobacteria bacterium]
RMAIELTTAWTSASATSQDPAVVVQLLWEFVYADASPLEEHLIRKLADLLYIEHHDCISAKLEARDATARRA